MTQKLALITGGLHRVGAAISARLAREGYALALHHHSGSDADPVLAEALAETGTENRRFAADLTDPAALADAVTASGATALYIHVDLDVLDPAVITGVALPVPFGLSLEQLVAAIAAVRARVPLVGGSIAGFAPASAGAAVDDLGTILRVVGALA